MATPTPADFLDAARVPDSLEPQEFGLWTIQRVRADESIMGELGWLGSRPHYTLLRRLTEATLHHAGEIVMEDSLRELRRHLPIWLAARGRVLVSGLGLGCVVRGLLASPAVEHVDVIELDDKVIKVVGAEFSRNTRVTLWHGDALTIEWPEEKRWDYAWHDIWCEGSGLQILHMELMKRYSPRCTMQGAWQFPRMFRRLIKRAGFRLIA